ncbi:late control protein D [Lactiplantibacillus sp. WILCCON 0030]|uniref:Late control protein D n=1 Tax=Lactiplantibacillus brownii TaxID=3069269 RepID=A0ABU1A8A9_9LACO|nr:late control protein D [Lactiplantibacillus brownii]MDQ7937108.1 late control protein D [Lactiplantibacillus brownii]
MAITTFTIGRRTTSDVWDVRELVAGDVVWTTDLNYSAGSLEFDVIEVDEGFTPHNGDIVKFYWDNVQLFYGFVFDFKYTNEKFSVIAYDKLRYLKNQDSLVWPVSTLSQRFNKVATMASISHRVVNGSNHKLAAEVADGKSYFDMLQSAIEITEQATGSLYFVMANYDKVELRKAPYKALTLVVGDKSLMTKFDYERSIEDAANVVRIVRSDDTTGGEKTATASSATTTKLTIATSGSKHSIDNWGRLQYVEQAKDKSNFAQMKTQAEQLLKVKNKQTTTLKLTVIGDPSLVAGNAVYLRVQSLKDIGLGTKSLLITKATHHFNADYTAEIEMKV